jgi:hypothetical protein
MSQVAVVDGLAGSLVDIAADPARSGLLYQFLGRYCHEFRNRLHSMKFCLYLANRSASDPKDEAWTELERRYLQVEQFVEQLQTTCRPMRLSPIRLSLGSILAERRPAWTQWLGQRGRTLELVFPKTAAYGCFDLSRLTHGLDALAAWRALAGGAGTLVQIEWGTEYDQLWLNWDEPGDTSLEAASLPTDRPISLALPMMARVLAAHGGSLTVALDNHLRFSMRWPCETPAAH